MIIDVHAHLGHDYVFDLEQTETQLVTAYEMWAVDKVIVQPFVARPYLEDVREAHDRIYALCQHYPGRFYGMASINPHFRQEDYWAEAERCVRSLGFLGLKITTIGHACHPGTKDGLHVFEAARSLGVPVMIHTGNGAPFADPASAWRAVESFPDVKVVLAHAGGNAMQQQAIIMAQKFDNVFLEPSWLPGVSIAEMIRQVGAERVLFSSDEVGNLPVALETFRISVPQPEEYSQVMWKTAHTVYGI